MQVVLENVALKVNEDIYFILTQIAGGEGVKTLEDGKTIEIKGEVVIKNCTLECVLEPHDETLFAGIC